MIAFPAFNDLRGCGITFISKGTHIRTMGVELLYPMRTYLIVSSDGERTNVMAADWVVPLSHEPFMVGVVISPKRLTYEFIEKTGEFVVAVPTLDLKMKVWKAGTVSGRDEDKSTLFKFVPSAKVGVPSIEECVANLECRVVEKREYGDHVFIAAEVLHSTYADFAFDGGARIDRIRFLAHTWGRAATFDTRYY